MKEPILPDRMVEHAEFCRHAILLMRLVLGCLSDGSLTGGDMSMDRVRRAVIVAKTRIQWDQEELLELIWRHLQGIGRHWLSQVIITTNDHSSLFLGIYDAYGASFLTSGV